ncbi:bifunctional helix-turn-helix transcriptional regulator/GNAT family N-acetyltransferase [Pedobacter sp. PAMC26386]|nr:bifunctional helix-turn-helix transcriptional regulator/GNAT family N-acetyltransferase [Pedobacter sp. PAMC26386]
MTIQKSIISNIRAFNRFYTDIIGLLDKHLLNSDYSLSEVRVLYEIYTGQDIQASQVMTTMHIDKSYLSRILKKLEKDRLIAKKPSDLDARAMVLSLTDIGLKLFQELNKASDDQTSDIIKNLNQQQRQQLVFHMNSIQHLLTCKDAGLENRLRLADIKIRQQLLPGDLGYIAYIHGKLYAEELGYGINFEAYVLEGLREFAKQYHPEKDRVWICEHEEKIIGFLVAFHREDSLQFRYFIFLPEYRGIGLGKKLMDQFLTFMKQAGYRKAFLYTTNEQQAGIALYEKNGFVLSEEKKSYAFGKELDERRYDLILG